MSRVPLLVANWKMHGRTAVASKYTAMLGGRLVASDRVQLVVCPPAVYLRQFRLELPAAIELGAQDCSWKDQDGPYTGEISAAMLADIGCRWVIIGHSERRALFGDDNNDRLRLKVMAACQAGLTPIVCVGETAEDRARNRTEQVVTSQLQGLFDGFPNGAGQIAAVAYEPVWAIGADRPATPDEAQHVHTLLRKTIASAGYSATRWRILYGGSVKPENVSAFLTKPDVDGVLVGGASLDAHAFSKIAVEAIEAIRN